MSQFHFCFYQLQVLSFSVFYCGFFYKGVSNLLSFAQRILAMGLKLYSCRGVQKACCHKLVLTVSDSFTYILAGHTETDTLHPFILFQHNAKYNYIFINRPGVAGAVLQSPP